MIYFYLIVKVHLTAPPNRRRLERSLLHLKKRSRGGSAIFLKIFSGAPGNSEALSRNRKSKFPYSTADQRGQRARGPPTLVGRGFPPALGKLKNTLTSPPTSVGGLRSGTPGKPRYWLPKHPARQNTPLREQQRAFPPNPRLRTGVFV